MQEEIVKIVVFVPETHGDVVRKALGNSGAGKIGNYTHCSISVKGVGRYIPGEGSNPFIGEVGKFEEVIEERIETPCNRSDLPQIIEAVKAAHPYEEPVIEVYPMIDISEFLS
jgi:hypothetical protein